jgi:hypothetical protein
VIFRWQREIAILRKTDRELLYREPTMTNREVKSDGVMTKRDLRIEEDRLGVIQTRKIERE